MRHLSCNLLCVVRGMSLVMCDDWSWRLLYGVTCDARDQDANGFVEFICGDLQQATMKA